MNPQGAVAAREKSSVLIISRMEDVAKRLAEIHSRLIAIVDAQFGSRPPQPEAQPEPKRPRTESAGNIGEMFNLLEKTETIITLIGSETIRLESL